MKMGILLAAATFVCFAGGSAFAARDFNGVTVQVVHTGETPTVHAGKQCFFKVQGDNSWFFIAQGPAGEFNCSIVLSAFESGRKVSFNHDNKQVKYLCVAVGNC